MKTATLTWSGFDNEEFERSFAAADLDHCRELVASRESADAVIAAARVALREQRYLDAIGFLSDVSWVSAETRLPRDILLGAAYALTRDCAAGNRLIERALSELTPDDPWYYEAIDYKGLIAWIRQDYAEAHEAATAELLSPDHNNRARARILLSWIALRRGEPARQVDELQKSLDELDGAEMPDNFLRGNALYTLAVLCRELPLDAAAQRVRTIYQSLAWTASLRLERFHVTRLLAAVDELDGNEIAAFSGFRKAARLAPSEHWSVLCLLDRALLAKNTGEMAFATEQLHEAHEIAQRLSWNVAGEERSALLVLAELFAYDNPAVAEQYLARFRTLATSVLPILSYGTDPRVKGFEAYSQGVAWLRLGDVGEAKTSLSEAFTIFEGFNYGWRAALCAAALYEVTHDGRWMQRAIQKIEPWPRSWIARRVADGTNAAALRLDRVPPAQRQVLELARAGKRNAEIASALGRSPHTVRNQLSDLFATFNVKSRAELVAALSKPVAAVTVLRQRRRHG